jgi:hypothetical protein
MRKLAGLHHGLRMYASRLRETRIKRQRMRSGLLTCLVRQHKKLLFRRELRVAKWNVGCARGGGL